MTHNPSTGQHSRIQGMTLHLSLINTFAAVTKSTEAAFQASPGLASCLRGNWYLEAALATNLEQMHGEEEAIRLSVKKYMTPLMLTTHTPLYNYFTTCRHCGPLTVLPSACRPPAGSGCPATGLLCEQGSGAGGGSHWQGTARWQGGRMPSFAGSTASGGTCREAPPQLV